MPLIPSSTSNKVFGFETTKQENFFKGSMNYKDLQWDPYVSGYSFIVWTKIPKWIESQFGEGNVQAFMQKNFHSFSQISSIELQTAMQSHGFTANESAFATTIQKGNTEFTLKLQEFSGSPVRNLFSFWVSGIRDPESGIATYPKMFGMDYAAKNHTGELLYIVTRPDANNVGRPIVEFACYYDAVFPVSIPMDHLNYEKGSHDGQELDIQFKGVFHTSPDVNDLALEKLKEVYYLREEAEYIASEPGVIGGGTKNSDNPSVFPNPFITNEANNIKTSK